MEYVKLPLQVCKTGEILAKDVLNKDGIILVSKDTQLNEYIIGRLVKLGQTEVWVYVQPSKDEKRNTNSYELAKENYISALKGIKNVIQSLSADKAVNYDEIQNLSQVLFTQNDNTGDILKFLNELRDFDDYTYTHSLNTAIYCMLICKWMKMTETEIKRSIQAGLLHDIGKIDIPIQILNKKGILTRDEFEIIKKHPNYGYARLNTFKGSSRIPDEVKKAVLLHHERIDGTGYPFQMTAGKINFFARIVSVADVFDAMTSDRVYKKRTSPFDVFEMYQTVGMSMFDPEIVDTFMKNISSFYTDVNVLLNDGRTGRVVYVPPQDTARPIVKVESGYVDLSKEESIKLLRII